jgi:iron complex outermembrane receptor protein
MYGFEMDSSLNFFDFFRLDGSAVYLNSKLQSATTPPPIPGYEVVLPSAVVGDELAYSPKWTANLSGTIMLPVSESLGKVELGATYRYQSSFATAASSASPMGTSLRASQVSQLDLNFDWKDIAGYPVDLSLFATNVTKQKTYVLITPLFGSFGFDVANLGEPRMYGLRLKVRFGEGLWD